MRLLDRFEAMGGVHSTDCIGSGDGVFVSRDDINASGNDVFVASDDIIASGNGLFVAGDDIIASGIDSFACLLAGFLVVGIA